VLEGEGRGEEAEAVYRRALEIGQRMEAQLGARTELRPTLASALASLANTWGKAGRAAEAEAVMRLSLHRYSQLVTEYPDHPFYRAQLGSMYQNLGRMLARTGRLEEAEVALRRATELRSPSYSPWCHLAAVQLARGDVAGYRRSCATLVGRFGQDDHPDVVHSAAWFCLRSPDAGVDPTDLVRMARKAVERGAGEGPGKRHDYLRTLGVALYRAGRYFEALGPLDESMKVQPSGDDACDRLFLAMAHHWLGHADEARRWYDRAVQREEQNRVRLLKDKIATEDWRRFRAEAAALLILADLPDDVFAGP
jgi:tetratricopeptide (TPR) repeat protein